MDRHLTARLSAQVAVAVTLTLGLLAGCASSSAGKPSLGTTASPQPASASARPPDRKQFYVSIGDSYAAGYQPSATGGVASFGHGFANQLPAKLEAKGYHMTLVNFACSGATTTSLVAKKSCRFAGAQGPNAATYPTQTQAQAALDFIAAHRSDVALVTVSISGNDITACGRGANTKASAVAACLTKQLNLVKTNLGRFLKQLRSAAGPVVPIVGLTYPDVILGGYVSPKPSARSLAALSVTAFKSLVNPTLKAQYDGIKATFVDITAASGAYVPFSQTTTLAPYGTIPAAVAKVCELTFYCQLQNIHPRTAGYTFIADQIAAVVPRR